MSRVSGPSAFVVTPKAQARQQTVFFGSGKKEQPVIDPQARRAGKGFLPPIASERAMKISSHYNDNHLLLGGPEILDKQGLQIESKKLGYFNIKRVDIPETDYLRIMKGLNPHVATFVAPNHPEYMTDWLVDKLIADMFAPKMAHWAAASLVKMPVAGAFLRRNNIIANDGGEKAENFSVSWAARGNGILLHPEGVVRWNGNKVHEIMPGVARMSVNAALSFLTKKMDKPVYTLPLVWKFRFNEDVSAGLQKEMAYVEKRLGLKFAKGELPVEQRFARLQTTILERQMKQYGYAEPDAMQNKNYFDRAEAFQEYLMGDLKQRYTIDESGSLDKRIHRYGKAIEMAKRSGTVDKATSKLDNEKCEELRRLRTFTRELYGNSTLSQEDMAETLKMNRQRLLTSLLDSMVYTNFPKPVGPRTVHIRAVEPMDVTEFVRQSTQKAPYDQLLNDATDEETRKALVNDLANQLAPRIQQGMQTRLDELLTEIEPQVGALRRPNPLL